MSDFGFHPNEPHVRQFRVRRGDVLRLDAKVYVSEASFGDVVLRRYAFRDECFKVNVTLDATGGTIRTAPEPGRPLFAFNCEIATPMVTSGAAVYSVDLFCGRARQGGWRSSSRCLSAPRPEPHNRGPGRRAA